MNDTSSRSHSVFTLHFQKKCKTSVGVETTYSKVSLIDLAGSERQSHTQATGDRLKVAGALCTLEFLSEVSVGSMCYQ